MCKGGCRGNGNAEEVALTFSTRCNTAKRSAGGHIEGKATWENVDFSLDGYLLGSYRIATAPEPNSSRLTNFKSIRFDSPANNVGP